MHPSRTGLHLLLAIGTVLATVLLLLARVDLTATLLVAGVGAAAAVGVGRLRASRRSQVAEAPAPRRDVVSVVSAVFALFAGWIVLQTVLTPSIRSAVDSPAATSNYSPLLVLVLLLGLPLAGAAFVAGRRSVGRRPALLVVLAALLVVKLVIGALMLKVPPFDAGSVFLAAYGDAVPGAADYPFSRDFADYYFSIYPNNLTIAGLLVGVFRVVALTGVTGFGTYAAVAVGLNAVALTATELLTFVVVRRSWGLRAAWVALAATALFTTLSPWINTPYSDTLGSVFPIGILALWGRLRSVRTRRALLASAALLGAVTAVGIAVKPTVVFALLAVVAVDVVRRRRILTRRSVVRAAAAVVGIGAVIGIVVALGSTALIAGSGLTRFDVWANRDAFPVAHFLKMGATGTGGFNGEDVATTYATPPDQRTSEALTVYAQRVGAMGPEGYALFLGEKALRTFGDGSFGQGTEGDPFPDYVLKAHAADAFRKWFTRDGTHHVSLASLWQAGWLLLLLACALPAARYARGRRRRTVDSTRIALLLLLAFLLLFETRARYLYLDLPLVVVTAVGTLAGVPAMLRDLRTRPLLEAIGLRNGPDPRRATPGANPALRPVRGVPSPSPWSRPRSRGAAVPRGVRHHHPG